MVDIIRCKHCRTFVYESAVSCHGCGKKLRGGPLLGLGAWIFILLGTTTYAVARGVDIIQTQEYAAQRAVARAANEELTNRESENFLKNWATASDKDLRRRLADTDADLQSRLIEVRNAFPDVFPCDVGELRIGKRRTSSVYVEKVRNDVRFGAPVFGDQRTTVRTRSSGRSSSARRPNVEAEDPRPDALEAVAYAMRIPQSTSFYFDGDRETRGWNDKVVEYRIFVTKGEREYQAAIGLHLEPARWGDFGVESDEGFLVRGLRVGSVVDLGTGALIVPKGS